MALTINTNIVNDADGYLLNTSNVKAGEQDGQRVMLDAYLAAAEQIVEGKEDIPEKASSVPAGGVLEANVMYYLGTLDEALSISFPSSANRGDFLFFSFNTGAVVPTITVSQAHSIGLENAVWDNDNAVYTCVAQWNGSVWVFAFSILSA